VPFHTSRWSLSAPLTAPERVIVLSLGSNIAPREEHILAGVARLTQVPRFRLVAFSSLYESEPVGIPTKTHFINAACVAACGLPARELLAACRGIERESGRVESSASRDRTLDIDIILYGDEVIEERDLAVPHPRFRARRFVLMPLMEIGPGIAVPPSGRTIGEIFRDCGDRAWVRRVSGRIDPLNFLKTK